MKKSALAKRGLRGVRPPIILYRFILCYAVALILVGVLLSLHITPNTDSKLTGLTIFDMIFSIPLAFLFVRVVSTVEQIKRIQGAIKWVLVIPSIVLVAIGIALALAYAWYLVTTQVPSGLVL